MNGHFDISHPDKVVRKGDYPDSFDDLRSMALAPNTHKFVLNFWDEVLQKKYERVKNLDISANITTIKYICNVSPYYFFQLTDPDGNIIEVTGTILRKRVSLMNDIVSAARTELDLFNNTPQGNRVKTGDIRKLSAKLYRGLKDKSKEAIFSVCNELLEQHNWPMGVIAFDFAYRVRKQYDENTFSLFENWLEKNIRGWGDCDDFCTHAFGELICQKTELSERVTAWTKRDGFWMRRASAVILIPSIWHDKYSETNPLQIADILMMDEHDLVRKGYGWMLKVLSIKEPELVYNYLLRHKASMPRVAFRYALEKMDVDKKRILMQE
jgi:3-methyladenine DNA glycosylase AlkD